MPVCGTDHHAAAAAATADHDGHAGLLDDLMARVASCFARQQTRLTCRRMLNGLLSELDDYNCWTLAKAAGHASPCPMQHLLSRARCDDRAMPEAAADWTVEQLNAEQGGTGGDAILIVDETSDEKSCADCAGAARQYCGATGSIALCQVAVTLTYAARPGTP
jgi:SRSO17 transposase